MRFRLRTLFILLTAICVVFGYVAYRLSRQGESFTGTNFGYHGKLTDPVLIAKIVREQTRSLPEHKPTDEEFVIPDRCAAFKRTLERSIVVDRFFYKVRLRDGSESHVGFWAYNQPPSSGRIEPGVTVLIHAWDTYPAVVSGTAARRRKEREELLETYCRILGKIQTDSDLGR